MGRLRTLILSAAAVAMVMGIPSPASAHGQPIDGLESRNSYCTRTASRGTLNKENPACAAAYQGPEGDQPGYDPFESNQSHGSRFASNGQVGPLIKEIVPDGQVCGAGRAKYAGFNTPTSAWPYRAYSPGANILYKYTAWAHHPGQIDLYASKKGFDPTTEALSWDDLEAEPFAVVSTDSIDGHSSEYNSPTYEKRITLPNRTGRLVVASIWRRSDSAEVFYYCSDLVLEAGASGEIYNLGAVEGEVAPPSTGGARKPAKTTTTAPATTTTAAPKSTTTAAPKTTTTAAPKTTVTTARKATVTTARKATVTTARKATTTAAPKTTVTTARKATVTTARKATVTTARKTTVTTAPATTTTAAPATTDQSSTAAGADNETSSAVAGGVDDGSADDGGADYGSADYGSAADGAGQDAGAGEVVLTPSQAAIDDVQTAADPVLASDQTETAMADGVTTDLEPSSFSWLAFVMGGTIALLAATALITVVFVLPRRRELLA